MKQPPAAQEVEGELKALSMHKETGVLLLCSARHPELNPRDESQDHSFIVGLWCVVFSLLSSHCLHPKQKDTKPFLAFLFKVEERETVTYLNSHYPELIHINL